MMLTIFKPGAGLYIMDWLSHNNHTENRDQKIAGIRVTVNAISASINMPVCASILDMQAATYENAHLWELKMYVTNT